MAKLKFLAVFAAITLLTACAENPEGPATGTLPSASWLQQTEQQAIDSGVAPQTVHDALDHFIPNQRVVDLDRKQPETTITFAAYRRNIVAQSRIEKGASLMRQYAAQLNAAQARTGVPPQIIVALWGVESSFGQNMGTFETVNSLATLAYEGRRAAFFRGELIASLHILDQEHLSASQLRGSWAGAMGQCQFMPSTYLKYAMDGDGDGKRDIWNDPNDVIASIANYLAAEGWRGDLNWGQAVDVNTPVDPAEIGLTQTHTLAEWVAKGITNADGSPLPASGQTASLLQPDGPGTDAFLVTDNLRALMRWNHSTYFTLSVGLLADGIAEQAR